MLEYLGLRGDPEMEIWIRLNKKNTKREQLLPFGYA